MSTPVIAQGPAMQGMATQGYAQGFPPPLGIEQYLGQGQQYGGFPQQPFTQSQFPGQQQGFGQQPQIHQIVQSLVTQLQPIAAQVILPQVVATAVQQIQVHLHQLVAQEVNWQLTQQSGWQRQLGQGSWQQPYLNQLTGWQQPQLGQQGNGPFGRFYTGSY